ncbi:MAG: hypothetical protein JOZ69_00125, partial [Myxococcales bacterium]|nr:hypothetical protein [Myxococcales bacterium]
DTEGTGNFNACVDGGRLRVDVNATDALMVYAQGIYADSKTEDASGACDALGRSLDRAHAEHTRDRVWDGLGGFEWYYQRARSHLFGWLGARDDTRADGQWAYREAHVEYDWSQFFWGPFSVEVQGRHRHRREENQNGGAYWTEGENYVAFKWAPRWVLTQGFEYTTLAGPAPLYLNAAVLYKFTSSSNVRVFVGQQRGAFRCASGICRYFPPFEGARAELTLRF